MHGLGNDYLYINCLASMPRDPQALSVEMSRRHTGAGSDGIILICPSEIADFKMRIFNADGSEARMCGNGSRCVGKYVYDYGLTDKTELTLETMSGVKTLWLNVENGVVVSVTVDMGRPTFECSEIPVRCPEDSMIECPVPTSAGEVVLTAVSMGNPHGVVFVDNLDVVDVHGLGRELEMHSIWPDRANIEFVRIVDDGNISMRVWERGSGETMACGTGACAAAVAAIATRRCKSPVSVHLPGGNLDVKLGDDCHVLMSGPAVTVYEGRYFRYKS